MKDQEELLRAAQEHSKLCGREEHLVFDFVAGYETARQDRMKDIVEGFRKHCYLIAIVKEGEGTVGYQTWSDPPWEKSRLFKGYNCFVAHQTSGKTYQEALDLMESQIQEFSKYIPMYKEALEKYSGLKIKRATRNGNTKEAERTD